MGKSYWFKDWPTGNGQKGNFSNNKQDTFNPKEGFIGTRLQQGVPLLDRDWNELEDIRRYQDVMLRKFYLGNGTPNDGFRISALDPPANDFMIYAGRFLVDGLEAVNEPAGANSILYSSQTGASALTKVKSTVPPDVATRNDTVYLDVWIEEVTGSDLPRLKNPDDVAMETCIRHRLRWIVRVDEGSLGHSPGEGHHFCDLANITRTSARDTIASVDIDDLRSGWLSLDNAQSRLRNALNSLASGNMPSDPVVDLTTFPSTGYSNNVVKDDLGNMIVFWWQDNNIWAKRYRASTRTWSPDTQITTGTAPKYINYAFDDSRGDIWVFWQQQEGTSNTYNIWTKRYSTSTGVWTGDIQLTSGASTKFIIKAFEDNKGNVWFSWGALEGTTNAYYNFWARKYTAGSWSGDFPLTSGTSGKSQSNIFSDSSGAVWFFWQQLDANNIYNLWAIRYGEGSWGGASQITSGTTNKSYLKSFEDNSGTIWLFWQQLDAPSNVYNIWSKRFKSGSWAGEVSLTSGSANKSYLNSFVDARGDIWLIWQQLDTVYNFWAKRFTANAWSTDTQLTTGANAKSYNNTFAGTKRDVWLLTSQADTTGIYNIFSQRFNFDSNQWENVQISSGSVNKFISNTVAFSNGNLGLFWIQDNSYVFNMFSIPDGGWLGFSQVTNSVNVYINRIIEKSNGEIWLLLYGPPFYNLWCKRFVDGDWVGEARLINGANRKSIVDVFEDANGDVWAFWYTYTNIAQDPNLRHLRSKKIYGSI